MLQLRIFSVATMSFSAISENEILAKNSKCTELHSAATLFGIEGFSGSSLTGVTVLCP